MALQGKGFFIWQVKNVEGGSAAAIASKAAAADLSHVLLKIADGNYPVNIDKASRVDLLPPIVMALKARGIQAWGWHYVYGYDPAGEARIAIQRIRELGLHGYVIDAEGEYKQDGRSTAALRFMHELRDQLPDLPIALSSFRFPSYHPQLPWKVFLDHCNYNMPQVYWLQATNAGAQLRRCVQEFQAMDPYRPVIPTGAAFKENGWRPTEAQIQEFLTTAHALTCQQSISSAGMNASRDLGSIWDQIARDPWPHGSQTPELTFVQKLFVALNTHDPRQLIKLYAAEAIVVTPEKTMAGAPAIQSWFENWFKSYPKAVFSLVGENKAGPICHFTWNALSPNGKIQDGSDTIGLINGKIVYHYRFFTVSAV